MVFLFLTGSKQIDPVSFYVAIHDRGWLAPSGTFPSFPRTTLSAGYDKQQIPTAALEALRRGMRRVHPELAEKEIVETRLCW